MSVTALTRAEWTRVTDLYYVTLLAECSKSRFIVHWRNVWELSVPQWIILSHFTDYQTLKYVRLSAFQYQMIAVRVKFIPVIEFRKEVVFSPSAAQSKHRILCPLIRHIVGSRWTSSSWFHFPHPKHHGHSPLEVNLSTYDWMSTGGIHTHHLLTHGAESFLRS
jgi:hypothetical protein